MKLYVIGDSTTARIHHLFKEEFGDDYDRYRGSAKNDFHDGTWNCKSTDFIVRHVLYDVCKSIDRHTTVLYNAGLWDVGIHQMNPMNDPHDYGGNTYAIFNALKMCTKRVYAFQTIRTTLHIGMNELIDQYNEVLKKECKSKGVTYIETPLFADHLYEPEGYHLNAEGNLHLYDIIVPKHLRR